MGRAELYAALVANGSVIEYASKEDIERAGLEDQVVMKLQADKWRLGKVEEYNAKYGCGTKPRGGRRV
jgi:hypothetical protein